MSFAIPLAEISVMDASNKSLLYGFLEVAPSLLKLFGVFEFSMCTSALLSSSPKECMPLDEVPNMSRISDFNLSFDFHAETIEKNLDTCGGLLLVLHVHCMSITEFCLRHAESRTSPHCLAHNLFVMLPVLITQYSLCLSSSTTNSFNKKYSFCELRT